MAPKRKPTDNSTQPSSTATTRPTRSSSRLASAAPTPPTTAAEPPKRKKTKTTTTTTTTTTTDADKPPTKVVGELKTITIEHCKQCNAFKTRAIQVKNGLEKGVAGVNVLVNPEKPRRGCFEIREEGGEVFVSLLDMKRPFAPMKALDMDKVISDIVEKIK